VEDGLRSLSWWMGRSALMCAFANQDGTLELLSAREAARRALGLFAHVAPGRSLVEELLAERREEARREEG
jgi:hypothetical protein